VPCHPFPHGTAAANRRLIQGIAVVNKSAGLAAGEVSHSDRLSFFSNKACELKVGSRSEILGRLLGSLLSGSGHPTTAPPRPGVVDLRTRRRHVFLFRNTPYSLQCSKGSRLGHDCAYQGVINYHRVFPVCPY
jgi:hypothetical protein